MEEKLIAERYRNHYFGDVTLEDNIKKNPFQGLAKDSGIDLTSQFLLGVTFLKNDISQTVIFTVTDVGTLYEEIKEYLKTNDSIPCKKYHIDMDINEFIKYTKRFSFMYTFTEELIGQDISEVETIPL